MKKIIFIIILIFLFISQVYTAEVYFDNVKLNTLPNGWICGVTGRGHPIWKILKDKTAPSKPNVLAQVGWGTFPWCVIKGISLKNGTIEVKFKPVAGRIDQAGGLVWRFKNEDNYYVARANALENNVSLYYVKNGIRRTIKYVDAPVPHNEWSTLKVEFTEERIKVFLNGKKYIDLKDNHIVNPGKVGVWTKADSKTYFDNFIYK